MRWLRQTPFNRHMNELPITLDNLSIGYNGQPVLSGISLSITRASFTAMVSNICYKSSI